MGIDAPSLALLSSAKHLGVDFDSTAMIGRQNFHGDVEAGLRRLLEEQKIQADARQLCKDNFFCEKVFNLLGARQIDSFDFSNYQEATHIHDMNQPIGMEFHQRYSCVYDGGTIEHVFNVSQALKNCLEMVRLGGHFMQVNMANNYAGHGFWQLSPEMIFRAISPENGFEIISVLLHEVVPRGVWYIVADPQKVGRRVELCNARPTYILTIAKRIAIKEVFATPPQQSDYVAEWNGGPPRTYGPRQPLLKRILGRIQRLGGRQMYDPRNYRHVDEAQVWQGKL